MLLGLNHILQPGLLGLLGPAAVSGSQGVALQQLLTAAAAGKDIPTILQEFAQQQHCDSMGSGAQHAGKPRSRSASPHIRRSKHKAEAHTRDDEAPICTQCRSRSSSPLSPKQQHQHHSRHAHSPRLAAASSSTDDEADQLNSSHRRGSSSSSSGSEGSSTFSSSDQCTQHKCHRCCSTPKASNPSKAPCGSAAAASHTGPIASLHPNMNITVRLKRHHLISAGLSSGPHDSVDVAPDNAADEYSSYINNTLSSGVRSSSASPGSHKTKGHRLRGHCSFTCDNPLFQLDLAAADTAAAAGAAAAAAHAGSRSHRPMSAGAVLDDLRGSNSSKLVR